jgi:hypothetical protein
MPSNVDPVTRELKVNPGWPPPALWRALSDWVAALGTIIWSRLRWMPQYLTPNVFCGVLGA